jgi:Zn-dependent metalloprotease
VYTLSSHIIGDVVGLGFDVVTYDASAYSYEGVETLLQTTNWTHQIDPVVIDPEQCRRNSILISAQERSSIDVLEATRYNNAVDCHFLVCSFIPYLRQIVHVSAISNRTTLSVLYGIGNCSNAAYFGHGVLVVGAGAAVSRPFGTADIIAHELGHGLIGGNGGARGEEGALHEHFADMIATSFEAYLCRTQPDLPIVSDYTIGEDRAFCAVLRNMANPWDQKQPRAYGGWYWKDPYSSVDRGYVHHNCSVGNFCFYLFSTAVGIPAATQIFLNVMYRAPKSYEEYSTLLQLYASSSNTRVQMESCLRKCGLLPSPSICNIL